MPLHPTFLSTSEIATVASAIYVEMSIILLTNVKSLDTLLLYGVTVFDLRPLFLKSAAVLARIEAKRLYQ